MKAYYAHEVPEETLEAIHNAQPSEAAQNMSKLDDLKEQRAEIENQINKYWFKIKLKREPSSQTEVFGEDFGKWQWLKKDCTKLIEEYQDLGGKITELEMQEIDKKIKEIWND